MKMIVSSILLLWKNLYETVHRAKLEQDATNCIHNVQVYAHEFIVYAKFLKADPDSFIG